MIADEKPDRDRIAISDTRPNMWLFVPSELGVMLFVGSFAIANQVGDPLAGLVVIPAWIVAACLCRRDPNGARVFMVQSRLLLLWVDAHRWGGATLTPWRARRAG